MRKRMPILLVLIALPLVLGVSSPTLADGGSGKITGGVNFPAIPEWGDFWLWFRFSVHETEPWDDDGYTVNADGRISWQIYSGEGIGGEHWRRLTATPVCVTFDEDTEGNPTAVVVAQITSQSGYKFVDYDEVGRYAKFWVRDGGTPGSEGDLWNVQSYQFPDEFWPEDDPPSCDHALYKPGQQAADVENGNLAIHP